MRREAQRDAPGRPVGGGRSSPDPRLTEAARWTERPIRPVGHSWRPHRITVATPLGAHAEPTPRKVLTWVLPFPLSYRVMARVTATGHDLRSFTCLHSPRRQPTDRLS